MLRSLFRRKPDELTATPLVAGQPARVPPGVCVYAVGDIHGRVDLLEEMHRLIAEDAALLTPGTNKLVVYLGDYVDRGLESRRVIDLLIRDRSAGLPGGASARQPRRLAAELPGRPGDRADLAALRRRCDHAQLRRAAAWRQDDLRFYEQLQSSLRERIPRRHVEFLQSLELSFESGDYLFVHAGVNPACPLDQQTADDLLWIREPFLSCTARSGQGRGPRPYRRSRAGRPRQSDRDRHRRLLDRLPDLPGARGERVPVPDHRRTCAGVPLPARSRPEISGVIWRGPGPHGGGRMCGS